MELELVHKLLTDQGPFIRNGRNCFLFSLGTFLLNYLPKKNYKEASNIVASIHALFSFGMAWRVIKYTKFYGFFSQDFPNLCDDECLRLLDVSMGFTLGYMIYDLLLLCKYDFRWSFFIHHLIIIINYTTCYYFRLGGYLPAMLQLGEFTTPFYYYMWFSKNCENSAQRLTGVVYNRIKIIFLVSFILIRGLFYGLLLVYPFYHIVLNSVKNGLKFHESYVFFCTFAFVMLNWFWIFSSIYGMWKISKLKVH